MYRELLIAPEEYKGIKRFNWYWRELIFPALMIIAALAVFPILAALLG